MARYPSNYAGPYGDGDGKSKKIRCRQCGQKALSNLVICPYCGRELYAAPSRLLIYGIPTVLAALFFFVIFIWGGTSPITWVRDAVDRGLEQLVRFEAQMEPGAEEPVVSVVTPITPGEDTVTPVVLVAEPPSESSEAGEGRSAEPEVALVPTEPPLATETTAPTDTPVSPTETATPALTPTPVPTATPVLPTATTIGENAAATRIAASLTALPATRTAVATSEEEAAFTQTITESVILQEATATATTVATATATATALETATVTATSTETPLPEPTATPVVRVAAATSTPSTTATRRATATVAATTTATATATATAMPTASPSATATATSNATPTSSPTNTIAPTPTAVPTNTPVPTSTPVVYVIQVGDTVSRVANLYRVTIEAIMQANGLSDDDLRRLRPGQELVIPIAGDANPAAGSAPAGNTSSGPTPAPRTYVIQAGDNPTTIARRFGVSVDALLAVNGLSREDASRLRVGQTLVIPSADQSGTDGTITTASATASTRSGFRLDAPILRSPEDGTPMSCTVSDSLVWQSVPFMAPGDKYIMYLGYVSGSNSDGSEQINWVLQQDREPTRTSWAMDSDYCSLAPQELGRQWRWYVVVIDENGVPVSPPSNIWRFSWN